MATYEEEVLADSPLAFWRLKEGAGATVMVDTSPNVNNGTYYNDAIFGFPPPVETDAGAAAVGNRVGEGDVTPKPTGNLAMEGWVYCPDVPFAVCHLITGVGQTGASGGIYTAYDSGTITTRFSTDGTTGTTVDMVYVVPVRDLFYHVVFNRNGTQLSMIVNGVLVDTAVTSADPITSSYTTEPWRIGVAATGNLWAGRGTAEPAVYDHPLTVARALAHYEAALNALFLNGRSDVIVTSTLSSLIEPAPISFPFRHNWADPLIERLSFRTAISSARTGAEEANSQRVAPRREFEFVQLLRNDIERRKFRAQLWANQHGKWLVPVRQDYEQLVVPLAATTTTIPVSTTYRDYEVGGYIGLRQLDDSGNITHWEEQLITSITPVAVECAALLNSYTPWLSWVYPVKRALLPRSLTIKGHTAAVEKATITAQLLPEDEAVAPNRIVPWTPTLKYRDYEVWDIAVWPSNDWGDLREYDVSRETDEVDFEGGGLLGVESDTIGASETLPWRIKTKGRETIARFLGWFYERRGRARYLWVPTLQSDFEVLTVDESDLTVADTNYSDNFALAEPRRDLAFVYYDGTMQFRRVVGFAGTTNETLTLDAGVPSLTNLRSVSLLKFCRLDGDQVEIAWHTDDVVEIAWAFREMLHTPEGTGLSSLSPSPSVSVSLSPSGSASPSSSVSLSKSPSLSLSPSSSISPSSSVSRSPSSSTSGSTSPSVSPSHSASPSV
jgi:hypothetical protein